MDRRQFLQTLNASGIGAILPASAMPPLFVPPLVADTAAVEASGTAWRIPKIGIISVGGIGGDCLPTSSDRVRSLPHLNRTVAVGTCGAELYGINADRKVLLGDSKTLLNPHCAELWIQSDCNLIADAVAGLDMVLLVAGMADATDTGGAPIVAQVLRAQGIHTLAFAVMPFDNEGPLRQQIARAGIRDLRPHVDALIPFVTNDFDPNIQTDWWQFVAARQTPLVLIELCRNVMNPVCRPGWVNVDFQDLRHFILNQEGECALGFGSAKDALSAATAAIEHPLLGRGRLERASSALIAINAPQQFLQLQDSWTVLNSVRKHMTRDAQVLFGTTYDENLGKEITVSILANGIRQT